MCKISISPTQKTVCWKMSYKMYLIEITFPSCNFLMTATFLFIGVFTYSWYEIRKKWCSNDKILTWVIFPQNNTQSAMPNGSQGLPRQNVGEISGWYLRDTTQEIGIKFYFMSVLYFSIGFLKIWQEELREKKHFLYSGIF